MNQHILEIHDLKRSYGKKVALDGVSLSVPAGGVFGLLGGNGAGKTTVLEDALKRQFSLLMGQKNALWWDLPARESLELNRTIYGIADKEYRDVVENLTALLEVRDKLDVMVRELSLGERMKFELIAALLHAPKVLFLDEPTIGLDVTSQQKVRDFLKHYNRERKIVTMLTSHYMGDIEALCQRVIIIDHGRIFFDGPLSGIIERFASHKILGFTIAETAAPDLAPYGEIMPKVDAQHRIRVARPKVMEICREVMARFPVTDMSVQEPPIEDVIREFFGTAGKPGSVKE